MCYFILVKSDEGEVPPQTFFREYPVGARVQEVRRMVAQEQAF